MTRDDFIINVAGKWLQDRLAILNAKGPEYTRRNNKLAHANMEKVGEFINLSPLQVWQVYFVKHIEAIFNYIECHVNEIPMPLSEPIEGRIYDAQNYLELLHAMINDIEEAKKTGFTAFKD